MAVMKTICTKISVAVGIILNQQQQVLLAWRGAHKQPGNCWEFPGGKIEQGEDSYQALCRELYEEVAIQVQEAKPLPSIIHEYENSYQVELFPWVVEQFLGIPQGMEGQKIIWSSTNLLKNYTLPSANYAIIDQFLLFHSKHSVLK